MDRVAENERAGAERNLDKGHIRPMQTD